MANEEHLAILKQGVETWNKWRGENPDVRPDLSHTDLRDPDLVDLSGVDLSHANLRGAVLDFADLRHANLCHAVLHGADLREVVLGHANLHGAVLDDADLRKADLRKADLYGADLRIADLSHANLHGADLCEVNLDHTILGDVDLSAIEGLGTVTHRGPSTIGVDSIYRSKGQIPESFLRGCGVPDTFIEFARSLALAEHPVDYYSCFISYSSDDEAFAKCLHADLQDNGVRCWFAPEDMKIGDRIRQRIDESIRIHDKLLLVLSDNSIDSQWVEKEVETAWEEERKRGETVLFPVRLDDSVFETNQAWAADVRRQRHIGDFREWKEHDSYQEAFGRLLRDLKAAS